MKSFISFGVIKTENKAKYVMRGKSTEDREKQIEKIRNLLDTTDISIRKAIVSTDK
jgi:hypothetical protein